MTDPLVAELRKFADLYKDSKIGSLLAQAAGRIERLEAPEIDRPEPMDKCGNCWACGVDLEWALDPKDPKAHAEYCRWVKSYPYGEKP